MHKSIDDGLSVALVLAAVAMAAVVVRRALSPPGGPPPSHHEPGWRSALTAGSVFGDSAAPVKLIEFADYQCPFCRTFDPIGDSLTARFPGQIAFVFVRFPLTTIHVHERRAPQPSVPRDDSVR